MKNKTFKTIGLAGLLTFSAGCLTTEGENFVRHLGYVAAEQAVVDSVTKEIYKDDEQERQRQAYEQTGNQQQFYTPEIPIGLFSFNKWVDFNNDNCMDRNEFFGLGKKTFNLNKEEMGVRFWLPEYKGMITFKSWTSTGELIGEDKCYANNMLMGGFIKLEGPTRGNFMGSIKRAGPGDYRITATLGDGRVDMIDVTIVE